MCCKLYQVNFLKLAIVIDLTAKGLLILIFLGAMSKTNLLFFIKGEATKEIWYYDLSDINVTKKQPLTLQHFDEFFKLLSEKTNSERSWKVSIEEIEKRNYDIKAVNPNRKHEEDIRTPEELLNIIESKTKEITEILKNLRSKGI
ncbi:MAG: N-6 DNA methylase [Elusimicrobiota bacterium]